MHKTKRQKEFWWDITIIAFVLILLLMLAVSCTSAVDTPHRYEPVVAYAGDKHMTLSEGDWWAVFTVQNGNQQPLYMNGRYIGGSMVYFNNGTISINLGNNIHLADVEVPVKVQGFSYEDMRFRSSSVIPFTTYQGSELEINTGHYEYFVIRIDVISDKQR